jgi:hypothetical protein
MCSAKVYPHPLQPQEEIVLWAKKCQECIKSDPNWMLKPVRCRSSKECPSWVNYEMRRDNES